MTAISTTNSTTSRASTSSGPPYCNSSRVVRQFTLPYFADYFGVPDGGFEEGAAGCDLSGGAAAVEGNETYAVGGAHRWLIASISAGESWAPSPIVPMSVNEIAPDHDNALPVSLRFIPRGEGTWQIDDVYVDPYRKG